MLEMNVRDEIKDRKHWRTLI